METSKDSKTISYTAPIGLYAVIGNMGRPAKPEMERAKEE